MGKTFCRVVIVFGAFSSAISLAQGNSFGADYLKLSSSVEGLNFDTSALQLRGSLPIHARIDIEGSLALGINEDKYTESYYEPLNGITITETVKVGLSNNLGVYLKIHGDTTAGFLFYGKFGYQMVNVDVTHTESGGGFTSIENKTYDAAGPAYNTGMSINMAGSNGAIALEYMVLPIVDINGSDLETNALSIGYKISI